MFVKPDNYFTHIFVFVVSCSIRWCFTVLGRLYTVICLISPAAVSYTFVLLATVR